jgi:ribose transport system substrate-binding protein
MGAEPIMRIRSATALVAISVLAGLALVAGLTGRMPHQQVIAVVPETTAQEIWESEHAGAARAVHDFGWKVYWNGPSREDDFPRQVQIVNQAIARKVDGLILSPDHDVVLISSVYAALARKIPTVIVGSPLGISPGGNLTFVVNDDAATGRVAAERAARLLKLGDTVAILGINPNIIGSIERTDAFEAVLHKRIGKVRIEERRSTSASYAEAEETAEDVIRADSHLRVIFTLSINQSRAAYGALQSMRASGKIALIACDQDLDLLHHLRSGGIDSLIAQNTYVMGYDAVQTIHKRLHGEYTAAKIVVPPVLVTKENVDSDSVQQVLDMNWRVQ